MRVRVPIVLLAGGVLLCAFTALVAGWHPALAAWLTAALLILGLPLGAMTLLMIHLLTGGVWGLALRPPLRAILSTLPLALLLLVPMAALVADLYPWAGAEPALLPETVRHKLAYLNVPFFLARSAVCAVGWLVLAWLVLGWTAPRDTATPSSRGAAAGLVVHGVLVTVFSIDWMLSLEPEFYSTIYPMLEAAAQAVGAFALAVVVVSATRSVEEAPGGTERVALSEDLANLLFGFVLIWVYLAFMQWLVIWAADLPHEISWYLHRVRRGWKYVLWLLIALHFVLPVAAFLNRDLKRSRLGIIGAGSIVLAGHAVDVVWRVRPPLEPSDALYRLADVAVLAGAGLIWSAAFLYGLSRFRPAETASPGTGHV